LRGVCDRQAVDGSADFLTLARFHHARLAAFIMAALLLVVGLAVVVFSRSLAERAAKGCCRLASDWRRTRRWWCRRYLRPRLLAWLAYLIILAGLCRLPGLVGMPPRADESFTYVHYASRPLFIVLSLYDQPNNHVFHSVLVYASTRLFGDAMWAVRLPAFLAGLLLVPLTFAWGRRQVGTEVGLLAAAWVAVAAPMIEYATNARGYSLVCVFSLLLLLTAREAVSGRNLVAALGFVLSAGLGLYTVPVMLFPFLGCLIWLAFVEGMRPARSHLLRLACLAVSAGLVAGVCYAPILATSGVRGLAGNEYMASQGIGAWFAGAATLADEIRRFWFGGHLALALSAVALVLVGGWRLRRRHPDAFWPVVALLSSVVVLAVGMRRWAPARALTFLIPFLAVWGSAGVRAIPARRLRWGVAALALAAYVSQLSHGDLVLASRETGTFVAAADFCDLLSTDLRPTDRIVLQGPSDGPMLYELQVRELPNTLLTRPIEEAGRLWLAISEQHGQTLASVLAVNGVALVDGQRLPHRMARMDGAVIVLLQKGEYRILPPLAPADPKGPETPSA
jgi:hypothetical protein